MTNEVTFPGPVAVGHLMIDDELISVTGVRHEGNRTHVTFNRGGSMNPRYIFVSGAIFYLIATLPGDDPIAASYEAQHCDVFGNVKGQPCRPGASYAKHFAVEGLWYLA